MAWRVSSSSPVLFFLVSEHVENQIRIGPGVSDELADGHIVRRRHVHDLLVYLARVDQIRLPRVGVHRLVEYIHRLVEYIHRLVEYIHRLIEHIPKCDGQGWPFPRP